MSLKMRQSLAEFEEQLRHAMHQESRQSERLRRHVHVRSRKRTIERHKKKSSMRFWVLASSLLLTAIAVAVAMFETLYWLLG